MRRVTETVDHSTGGIDAATLNCVDFDDRGYNIGAKSWGKIDRGFASINSVQHRVNINGH
jgi:hypothetical protein